MEFYIVIYMRATSLTLLLTAAWIFLENPNKAIDQAYVTGRKVELILLFAITFAVLSVAFQP